MYLGEEEQLGIPGRFILETLEMENFSGQTVDLRDFFTTISYTEDIFSPVVYGSVGIRDGIDIHQYLPVCGEETLRIVYTSTDNKEVDKEFRIYRIGTKSTSSNNTEEYTLYFCSPELITDKRTKISKSYRSHSLAEITKDALNNYIATDKDVILENTLGTYHTIIPNLSPFQAIQWCCSQSRSRNSEGALYTFYENRDGFRLSNIETLMSNEVVNPESTIRYNIQNVTNPGTSQLFPEVTLISYNVERGSKDVLSSMRDGVFANRVYTIDPLTREHRINDYSYDTNKDDTIHLDDDSLLSRNYDAFEPEQRISVRPTQTYRSESSYYEEKHTGEVYPEPESVVGYRTAQLGQLTSIAVIGQMYGVTDYTAGDTVDMQIPNNTKLESKQSEEQHKYISGKFLIKSIKHSITVDNYMMEVTFLKDTLNSELEYDFD